MMDLDNRLTDDETLEAAYDIFLELAQDNLDPADILLFNLQFEQRGRQSCLTPQRRGMSRWISISTPICSPKW
ncbi:hypothetical protein SODG_004359 [Sodalis praecaptivus]